MEYAIGIDLGGTNIKFGLVSKDGKLSGNYSLKTYAEKGPDFVIDRIVEGIELIREKSTVNICGIGIGSPGIIPLNTGIVENPPNLPGWNKIPLGNIIKERIGLDVFVENDANAAAIGEMIFGAGKKLESFILVTLGTGVGGGIIFKRKLFKGEHGGAGELGHISISHNGKKCKCGSRGCVEAYIGNNYLVARVKKQLGLKENKKSKLHKLIKLHENRLSARLISQASKMGDEFSDNVIIETGKYLGYALSSVVNLTDITNIIIGGGVSGFGKLLIESTEKTIKNRVLETLKTNIKVKRAQLKNSAGVKGAGSLVFYKD